MTEVSTLLFRNVVRSAMLKKLLTGSAIIIVVRSDDAAEGPAENSSDVWVGTDDFRVSNMQHTSTTCFDDCSRDRNVVRVSRDGKRCDLSRLKGEHRLYPTSCSRKSWLVNSLLRCTHSFASLSCFPADCVTN